MLNYTHLEERLSNKRQEMNSKKGKQIQYREKSMANQT